MERVRLVGEMVPLSAKQAARRLSGFLEGKDLKEPYAQLALVANALESSAKLEKKAKKKTKRRREEADDDDDAGEASQVDQVPDHHHHEQQADSVEPSTGIDEKGEKKNKKSKKHKKDDA